MADTHVRIRAVVRGIVQGVGYRFFTLGSARRLGIRGTVCNRPDGTVEVAAQGSPDRVDTFLGLLRQGPRASRVDGVDVERLPPQDPPPRGFEITF